MKLLENEYTNDRYTIDRRKKILELLQQVGQVKVTDLSKTFQVSEVTIRNDLTHLEKKGLLIKTRGGGLRSQVVGIDTRLNEKSKIHSIEKTLIGKKAAEIISDGDTIIIDSGTTTVEVAKNLSGFRDLTIITNALNIVSQLVNYNHFKIILLGGLLRETSLSLVGPLSESGLKNYFCDKVFLGVDGIDAEFGISTPNAEEANLNKLMIQYSKQVIVVTDSTKFNRRSFAHIAPINKINTIITDSNIPQDELKTLRDLGINVIIA